MSMVVMCTDFGPGGPYTGQLQAVLAREAPGVTVVSLFDDLPAGRVQSAAYLLPAYVDELPLDSIFLCVVDPGVGTDSREPMVMRADGRWFVGPDNGLLAIVARRARQVNYWHIDWQPKRLSASFHGRDLFAPVAAMLARGEAVPGKEVLTSGTDTSSWPDELAEIIYIDPFGNCMTGIRAATLDDAGRVLLADGQELPRSITFGDVATGEAFCYENANGLLEVAVNQGRAADELGLKVGVSIHTD
jgi:S-adenosylmethionine hydrolase